MTSKYDLDKLVKKNTENFVSVIPIIKTVDDCVVIMRMEDLPIFDLGITKPYLRSLTKNLSKDTKFVEGLGDILASAGIELTEAPETSYQKIFPVETKTGASFYHLNVLVIDYTKFKWTVAPSDTFEHPGSIVRLSAEEFKNMYLEGSHDLPTELLGIMVISILNDLVGGLNGK